jgi:hypothetical protein
MAYIKRVKIFRSTLLRLLKRLAKNGCGDGGWCECLLCRIMRVVQTEQFRNKPIHKSSFPSPDQPASEHTRMVHWRGGLIEFAQDCREDISAEPWWGIKIKHKHSSRPYIWWLDYCGPPHLYLTKKVAQSHAHQLRKQYKCRIKVVPIGELKNQK